MFQEYTLGMLSCINPSVIDFFLTLYTCPLSLLLEWPRGLNLKCKKAPSHTSEEVFAALPRTSRFFLETMSTQKVSCVSSHGGLEQNEKVNYI